jgi:hypothetical protein
LREKLYWLAVALHRLCKEAFLQSSIKSPARESNIRLREEIRKRTSRIDLVFGVRKKLVLVKVAFVNDAVKWALVDGDRSISYDLKNRNIAFTGYAEVDIDDGAFEALQLFCVKSTGSRKDHRR